MRNAAASFYIVIIAVMLVSCSTAYKAKPLPFKTPGAYENSMTVAGADIAARAYTEPGAAKEAFGFDVRGAGILPVQLVFDNRGTHSLEIDPSQTFLEDNEGNLWPVLDRDLAYERATKYAETSEIFREGLYHGFLGAAAGTLIGAAVGIISGDNVAQAAGKGAAAGTAAGALIGGIKGYGSKKAERSIMKDLRKKSLKSGPVHSASLAYGFIFFPGEAKSARQLRLKLIEKDSGAFHVVLFNL